MKAFIARDSDGKLFLYSPNPPIKETTQWISLDGRSSIFRIDDGLFPEVKWEDKEPTEIDIQIVTKSLDSSQLSQQQLTK